MAKVVKFTQPELLVTVYVMIAAPTVTPVTAPVAAFTVATAALLQLQVPPVVEFAITAVVPTCMTAGPVISASVGNALTVIASDFEKLPQLFVAV